MQNFAAVLALSAMAYALPSPQDGGALAATCGQLSPEASFVLDNVQFEGQAFFSTPAHYYSSEGTISFNLTLSVISDVLQCTAETDDTYPTWFDGETWYDCVPATEYADASFSYNYSEGIVKVKTDWRCPESDVSYTAEGQAGNGGGSGLCDHNTVENPPTEKFAVVKSDFCFDGELVGTFDTITGVA